LLNRFVSFASSGLYSKPSVHTFKYAFSTLTSYTPAATTKLTVTDIAISCGFNDSNYFKDAFKKTYGLSPRHYRKSSEAQINE